MLFFDPSTAAWRKSPDSGANGCVEVAPLPDGGAAIRDSKLGDGSPVLFFDQVEWDAFRKGVVNGAFDL
jgi:hypothetical protein